MTARGLSSFDRHVAVLERTPAVLRALLDGHSDGVLHANYGPGTWSPFEVLGHLIQGEIEDWVVRARIILEHGTARAFDAFDHRASGNDSMGTTIAARLDAFERLRSENLATLRAMGIDDAGLALRGLHPALGEVTLGNLIATWATHDLHHVAQICKAMAHQNRKDVGAWRAYLGILATGTP